MRSKSYEYDVALSFAGENRKYVEEVAKVLKEKGINVFYDLFEEANLWGKNLYDYLSEVYQSKAHYTVIFISKFYNKKLWTNHERVAMQARAFQESQEYILPARFDDTEIPGILRTIGYINLQHKNPMELATIIGRKIGREKRHPNRIRKITESKAHKPYIFAVKVHTKRGVPVMQAKVTLVAKNNTYMEGFTDESGFAYFVIKTKSIFSVLVAHSLYQGYHLSDVNTKEDISIIMQKARGSGSIIFKRVGEIPGISGKIEAFKKKNNQLFLFADNLAIEGGMEQPFNFELNRVVSVEDNQGKVLHLVFRFLQGSIVLLDFNKLKTQIS